MSEPDPEPAHEIIVNPLDRSTKDLAQTCAPSATAAGAGVAKRWRCAPRAAARARMLGVTSHLEVSRRSYRCRAPRSALLSGPKSTLRTERVDLS
jgi:hypothetical protein